MKSRKREVFEIFSSILSTLPAICTVIGRTHYSVYGDWGVKVSILEGDKIRHFERRVLTNMCLILNIYRDRDIWISRPNYVSLCFWGFMKKEIYNKISRQTRRILHCHFGRCCSNKGTWKSTQTNKTQSLHTRFKIHGSLKCNSRPFIVNCNKFVLSVQQICLLNI